jgi:hypothetical protein
MMAIVQKRKILKYYDLIYVSTSSVLKEVECHTGVSTHSTPQDTL